MSWEKMEEGQGTDTKAEQTRRTIAKNPTVPVAADPPHLGTQTRRTFTHSSYPPSPERVEPLGDAEPLPVDLPGRPWAGKCRMKHGAGAKQG